MDEKEIKRIIEDGYDESEEDTVGSMVKEVYKKKMRKAAILWGSYCGFFYVLGVISAVLLFRADQIRYQILLAAAFLFFMQRAALVKIIGWQWLHQNSIKRELKRLELRVAELSHSLKDR